MVLENVTLRVPENLYRRLESTARATQRPLEDVMLHALNVGSPPGWEDAPPEFQTELAMLDRLEDDALWQIARGHKTLADMERYDTLLEKKQTQALTEAEQLELTALRTQAERFMLRKAQAAVLLRWRGHPVTAF